MKLDRIINNIQTKEKAEVLSVAQMTGAKYEPLRKHRWILCIEGVDSFFMKKVELPSLSLNAVHKSDFIAGRNPSCPAYETSEMSFIMYDPIAPSGTQQITEWVSDSKLNHGWRSAEFKMIDPLGVVIEKWEMDLIITSFQMSEFNYDRSDAVEITVSAISRNVKINETKMD